MTIKSLVASGVVGIVVSTTCVFGMENVLLPDGSSVARSEVLETFGRVRELRNDGDAVLRQFWYLHYDPSSRKFLDKAFIARLCELGLADQDGLLTPATRNFFRTSIVRYTKDHGWQHEFVGIVPTKKTE